MFFIQLLTKGKATLERGIQGQEKHSKNTRNPRFGLLLILVLKEEKEPHPQVSEKCSVLLSANVIFTSGSFFPPLTPSMPFHFPNLGQKESPYLSPH